MKVNKTLLIICILCSFLDLQAQNEDISSVRAFLMSQKGSLDIDSDDINHAIVSNAYTDKNSNIQYIYLNQTVNGISIQNAINTFSIRPNGKITLHGNKWVKNLHTKIANDQFLLSHQAAANAALQAFGLEQTAPLVLKEKTSDHTFIYQSINGTDGDVLINKRFTKGVNQQIYASWEVNLDMASSADYWRVAIDAASGDVIQKINYTTYCRFGDKEHNHSACSQNHKASIPPKSAPSTLTSEGSNAIGSYRVYPWPLIGPNEGPHQLVTDPHDLIASPYGWHDTNGQEGAESTITKGNNVHAYNDRIASNQSQGDEPDGGAELNFDFAHNLDDEPDFSLDAITTQLFYSSNKMHDFAYKFGFDEPAGNFQQSNYGNPGLGFDFVQAECYDRTIDDLNGNPFENNANFATLPDGFSPRMQMYLWRQVDSKLSGVTEPESIAGIIETGTVPLDGSWGFSEYATIEGKVVRAVDGTISKPTLCCEDIINDDEVAGNIALIDRGECEFGAKALNAQTNGAIACIICNFEDNLLSMGSGEFGIDVTIPTIQYTRTECDKILGIMQTGEDVIVRIEPQEITGPTFLDASFDNTIVAHEYAHGISGRLVGGSSNTGCLPVFDTNDDDIDDRGEQMGEGWSDFFALAVTVKEGDVGEQIRGMFTYLNGEEPNGRGDRTVPYSTDFMVNNETYNNIKINSVPHGVGQVWAAMLWDMYWALCDEYGFDPTYTDENSGSYKAVKLVMEGLRVTPCEPGFVDARNAIFEADEALYNNENNCLLWSVFAKRGLGYYADQGDSVDQRDGTEDFEPLPTCIQTLKIKKTQPGLIAAGDSFEESVYIANHTLGMATNVQVVEQIPNGLTYVSTTASVAPSVNGNELTFDFGDLASLFEETFTITYASDPDNFSITIAYDNMESSTQDWDIPFDGAENVNFFQKTSLEAYSPTKSFYVEELEEESDQSLVYSNLKIDAARPVLRFWHKFNTEKAVDGGFVRVADAGSFLWEDVKDKFIRNGYGDAVQYATFAIPNLFVFSGLETTFIDSYIDLSDYAGSDLDIMFRFGTDENTIAANNSNIKPGWYIDDFEFMDMKTYESEICISSDSESLCDDGLTIIDSDGISNAEDLTVLSEITLFPNPTSGNTHLFVDSKEIFNIQVVDIQGRVILSESQFNPSVNGSLELETAHLTNGMYFVQLKSSSLQQSKKLIIQK